MRIPRPSLEARIAHIKQEIISLGADLQPGILTQQYNVCGKAVCRCKADPPQRHGPYYQLSFTRKGKSTTQFVKPRDLQLVRQQVRNYRRLRRLTDRWIALGMELARLRLRQERASRAVSSPKKRAKARIRQGKRA
jgi:Family of unknown function (DUF6788)